MLSFFLPCYTINNRDKGFIVARETVAIKVSGCFQSVNSRCRKVGARQRPPELPSMLFLPLSCRFAILVRRRYRRRWSVSLGTRMLHSLPLFASNHGIGSFPRRDTLSLRSQKCYATRTLQSHFQNCQICSISTIL